jgi:hypothetical protein
VCGVDHRAAVLVRDQILVERGQEQSARRRRSGARGIRAEIRGSVDLLGDQRALDRFQGRAGVGGREPGPPDEIGERGRAATREVAPRELGERRVARERLLLRNAPVEQDVRALLALARTARDQTLELGMSEQV